MKLRSKGINRRDLVKRLGGAAFALPFLELFEREVQAQTLARRSKYIVFIYTNDGVNNGAFWPTGGDPTNSPTLKSLAPYKDKVLVLGPQLNGTSPKGDTGMTYNTRPAQHRAAVCLTATKVNLPLNGDQFRAVNKVDGPSIDYVIGEGLKAKDGANATLFPYLNFGIHPIGGDTPSEINYDMTGQPIPRMSSADEVAKRLFGGMAPGGTPGMGNADAAGELRKHTAITDFLHNRFNTVRKELSPYDQGVVDRHLTSLRSFEDRRSKLLAMRSNPQAACGGPAIDKVPTDATSVRTGADTQFLAPYFMSSIATAFACNMTRVASVTFGYPGGGGEGGLRMPWLGFTDAQHSVSHHGGGAEKLRKYGLMNAWTISQVKFLMDQLAAVPTASGTLLDDTTIYFFNRHGDGNGHTNFALPNLILGGTGGFFKTGQILALPKTSPTQVLLALAYSMGIELKSFGSGAFVDTNPMPGITT
jgi:hypothetical protein